MGCLAGVPHMTTEHDVYEGYFIPKGRDTHSCQAYIPLIRRLDTIVFANIWCVDVRRDVCAACLSASR
jgi:hypothetical protein